MSFRKQPNVDVENNANVPTFDEIIFEFRNKEYGAFIIRKKYNKYMAIALSIGVMLAICAAFTTSYLSAKANFGRVEVREERGVFVQMANLDLPRDFFEPASPPPSQPPPAEEVAQQQVYVAPVVVDVVSFEDEFMTFDEIREEFTDRAVDEIIDITAATGSRSTGQRSGTGTGTGLGGGGNGDGTEILGIVENMPEFPGGDLALRRFIERNVKYPAVAQENGIKGKVYVTFVVERDGSVSNAKVTIGVHPLLDSEALRVINILPKFKAGTQGGRPVRVLYNVPINFAI